MHVPSNPVRPVKRIPRPLVPKAETLTPDLCPQIPRPEPLNPQPQMLPSASSAFICGSSLRGLSSGLGLFHDRRPSIYPPFAESLTTEIPASKRPRKAHFFAVQYFYARSPLFPRPSRSPAPCSPPSMASWARCPCHIFLPVHLRFLSPSCLKTKQTRAGKPVFCLLYPVYSSPLRVLRALRGFILRVHPRPSAVSFPPSWFSLLACHRVGVQAKDGLEVFGRGRHNDASHEGARGARLRAAN